MRKYIMIFEYEALDDEVAWDLQANVQDLIQDEGLPGFKEHGIYYAEGFGLSGDTEQVDA